MPAERSGGVEHIPVSGQGEEPAPDAHETPEEPAQLTEALGTAAKLLVGTASLGLEAFQSRLRSLGREGPSSETGSKPREDPSVTESMIGAATRGARAVYSATAVGVGLARRGLRTAGQMTEAVGRVVPGFVSEPVSRVRRAAGERIGDLGSAGRDELARARQMARSVLDDTLDSLIERMADDPAVREAIRTQSTTAVEDAVDDVRTRAAGMDDRMESFARRLLRRKPRAPASPSQ